MMMLMRSKHSKVRTLAVVLLRQHFDILDKKLWAFESLPSERRESLKKALLNGIQSTADEDMRRKITDCASELAISLIPKEEELGGWSQFIPFALQLCRNQTTKGLRIAGFRILENLAVWVSEEFEDEGYEQLREACDGGLGDSELDVRLAAHKAICAVVPCCIEQDQLDQFIPLFPRMVELCTALVANNKQRPARQALEGVCDAIEANPAFLEPHLDLFVNTMLRLALAPPERRVEMQTKQMAVETLLTLSEVRPGLARKVPQVVKSVLPMAFRCMTHYEQVEMDDWNLGPDQDPDEDSIDWGEETVNRLCQAMGGEMCTPQVLSLAKSYAVHKEWAYRSVCLRAITQAAEGLEGELYDALPEFLPAAIQRLAKDPHPRVRITVATVIGQLALDYRKKFTTQYHKLCVPAMCMLLSDKENPRVQAQAAAAFVNWADVCSRVSLESYFDRLAALLHANVSSEIPLVEEATVTAVSSLADSMGEDFSRYWPRFAAPMKAIWSRRIAPTERRLRGKTLEALTLIGVNLTKKHFHQEAIELGRILQTFTKLEADDPLVSYCQQAWARLCKILGQEFLPFLPNVMPSLLHSAGLPPDIEIHEGSYRTHREGWSVVSIGDKSVAINSHRLQEKATAINMLFCLATDLDHSFFPYVKQVARITIPLLNFNYSEECRDGSFCLMSTLLTCVRNHCLKNQMPPALVHQLWQKMLPSFLSAIRREVDLDVLLTQLDALQECINLAGPGSMGPKELSDLSVCINQQLVDHLGRIHHREQRRKDPLFDKQDAKKIEKQNLEDSFIVRALSEVVGKTFKQFGPNYLPIFHKQLSPTVISFLEEGRRPEALTAAFCIFDDLIEFCQSASAKAVKFILPHFARGARHADSAVRQACLYGLGQCAQHGGEAFAPSLESCIGLLGKTISDKQSRKEENLYATENAISAFGKVLLYWWNSIPAEKRAGLVASFLMWLPVRHDDVESKITYSTLCSLFERYPEVMVGADKKRLGHCIKVFGFIFNNKKLIEEATNARIAAIVRKIRTTWPAEADAVWQKLSEAEQTKLGPLFN